MLYEEVVEYVDSPDAFNDFDYINEKEHTFANFRSSSAENSSKRKVKKSHHQYTTKPIEKI